MNRRTLLSNLIAGFTGAALAPALDPEEALWVPGKKLISILPFIAGPQLITCEQVHPPGSEYPYLIVIASPSIDPFSSGQPRRKETLFFTSQRLDGTFSHKEVTKDEHRALCYQLELVPSYGPRTVFVETEQSRKYGVKWMATPNGLVKVKPGANS